ncbi:hypothetical protein GGS23DRAFT_621132 [Durotheca rogersii]|uniref:uncharacterized protein n=1 Tax=Durotheca rogersii TaxID=419775 RepID=UPI00222089AE|nr:uncharacterized protein GGS23DRAFT_621132 [Durotheca rogersii]KAI5863475.1 hypothetical protein GGS23DRAFT_621132 [Durotheca rogersii]
MLTPLSLSKATQDEKTKSDEYLHNDESKNSDGEVAMHKEGQNEKSSSSPPPVPAHERFLPGCSAGASNGEGGKQVISNSMMQTYIAMRGPGMGGDRDPLFDWIGGRPCQPNKASTQTGDAQAGDKKSVSRIIKMMSKALRSSTTASTSSRDAVFEVKRPAIGHIRAPADADLTLHAMSAASGRCHFGKEDEDDDEGGRPSGRISPCTFAAWACGCKRWAHDVDIKDPSGVSAPNLIRRSREQADAPAPAPAPAPDINAKDQLLARATRLRPPTPPAPAPSEAHFPKYYAGAAAQVDGSTGEQISPCYPVPSNPSIIYDPPAPPEQAYLSGSFHDKFSRMAPLDARTFREKHYGKPIPDTKSTTDSETYGRTEVEAAARTFALPTSLLGGPSRSTASAASSAAGLRAGLEAQWRAVAACEAEERALARSAAAQAGRVAALERERDGLRAARRAARLREHIAVHARDARHRLDRAAARRDDARERLAAAERREDELRAEIARARPRRGVAAPRWPFSDAETETAGSQPAQDDDDDDAAAEPASYDYGNDNVAACGGRPGAGPYAGDSGASSASARPGTRAPASTPVPGVFAQLYDEQGVYAPSRASPRGSGDAGGDGSQGPHAAWRAAAGEADGYLVAQAPAHY